MNDTAKEFWNRQTNSLHRSDDEQFYHQKAEEHASLMSPQERSAGCVDLGCGAGELLLHFTEHVTVRTGIDYAQSMLDEAGKRLAGKSIELLNADIFEYLPGSDSPVWTTTGAINQYLDPHRLNAFLDIFAGNASVRSLFLFDCVDPVRYALMPFGISYRPKQLSRSGGWKAMLRPVYWLARRLLLGIKLALGLLGADFKKLPGAGMGIGFLPGFWIDEAHARHLQIDIVSSRFYEYRYHVILRKPVA